MQVIAEKGKAPIKAWIDGVELEDSARQQLLNVASMPFIHKHIAIMPDVHWGMGATIGSVIPTLSAIIPAAVGVDIGCGMMAVKTSLTAHVMPDNLHEIRSEIERLVPHGRTNNGAQGDRGAWHDLPEKQASDWNTVFSDRYKAIVEKHPKAEARNTANHLGTLGSGNHFMELCTDENNDIWIMLHSGSRGLGNKIGSYFIERAQKECTTWFVGLPDKDLAYLPEGTALFDDYIEAVSFSQEFAMHNRGMMMAQVIEALRKFFPDMTLAETAVNCHHNYVEREHHFGKNVIVTRKGAVRARKTDLGIIPGSMGAKSFIVRGKGNEDSFCSCSHGAGRRMSRTAAQKKYTVEDHIQATAGVECRKDAEVIDETPMAYKDIDAVMAAQSDLVEIVHTLKQIVCVKG